MDQGSGIRRAVASDAEVLAALAERTFCDTFAAENSPADMAAHVARSYSPALQGRELADPADRSGDGEAGRGRRTVIVESQPK